MIRKTNNRSLLPSFSLLSALLLTGILVYLLVQRVTGVTGGLFIYPLDDPYIHMQIARNIVQSGTWGINPGEFGSASSSLLYTGILTILFKLFGIKAILPLIINCVSAVFLLYVINNWLVRQQVSRLVQFLTLHALVVLGPLPVLIISGMEHTLQALFFFLFITRFAEWFQQQREPALDRAHFPPWQLLLLAMLVVGIRYEGLFIVFGACVLLLFRKKIISPVVLGLCALLPVIVFGLYSVAKGSYFLPNSVLVKSEGMTLSPGGILSFLQKLLVEKMTVVDPDAAPIGSPRPGISLLTTQRLLMILPLLYLFYQLINDARKTYGTILLLLMFGTVLHLCLAATGWFYRYEAYLLISTIVIMGVLLAKLAGNIFLLHKNNAWIKWSSGLLLFALFFPMLLRAGAAYTKASRASINIYQQQYQMSRFLSANYNTATVAANDIGAISFFTGITTIDLWGLGNIDVARSKKGKYWTPAFLDSLVSAKHAAIAIVYDEWFDKELLARWTKVASWKIPDNVICGSDVVHFYSIHKADTAILREKLMAFRTNLPAAVTVEWAP